jgi:hypothetical protein
MEIGMSTDESFILPKKEDLELTLRSKNANELTKFLDQPALYIAETVTGALAEGMNGVALSAGRLVQGALKVQLLTQVAREIKYFQEKGKIKEDYAEDKYGFQTWVELLEIVDAEAPDEDKLKALKAMFLAVNRINTTDGDKIANYQLFQLAKKLSSGQLLILRAAYRQHLEARFNPGLIAREEWCRRIALQLGHSIISLIAHDENILVEYRLINPPQGDVTEGMNARLTDLAMRLCQNIATYERDTKQ